MQRKHLKQFPSTMKQSTESMYLIEWPRNTFAEPAHEDGQYIVSKTLYLAAINT